jgi:hypothetical protein
MQMSPNDLNDSDRQVYRRWTIAFGMIALVFVGLIASHPPITAEVVAQVEGMKSAEVAGPIPDVSRIAKK